MPEVKLEGERLVAGRFSLELIRTLRVPCDGKSYPLPPGFSSFPVYAISDYAKRLPGALADRAAYFVPLYQYEALWLSFTGASWKPNAVQVGAGGVNVLTGEPFPSALRKRPQNYVVCPPQPWLDGFKTAKNTVSQFVAAPLGKGVTAGEQLGGAKGNPSLHLRVFEPRPGVFPDKPPRGFTQFGLYAESVSPMGLAAGGSIEQEVYSDPHPLRTWNPAGYSDIRIEIVNSEDFRLITGKKPPPSPVSAAEYSRARFPWFSYYDEEHAGTTVAKRMKSLKTLELDDAPIDIGNVREIRPPKPKRDKS